MHPPISKRAAMGTMPAATAAPKVDRIGTGFVRFIAHAIDLAGGSLSHEAAELLLETGAALDQELADLRKLTAAARAQEMAARDAPDLDMVRNLEGSI